MQEKLQRTETEKWRPADEGTMYAIHSIQCIIHIEGTCILNTLKVQCILYTLKVHVMYVKQPVIVL